MVNVEVLEGVGEGGVCLGPIRLRVLVVIRVEFFLVHDFFEFGVFHAETEAVVEVVADTDIMLVTM